MLRPLLLAACACILGAAEPVTGYASNEGALNLSDARGTIVDLAPMAWGPKWAWTGMACKTVNEQGATAATLTGKLGGTNVPFRLELKAVRTAPTVLTVTGALTVEKDSDLTMVILSLSPGERFRGEKRCTVTEGGADIPRPVPFGKEALGKAVSAVRFAADGDSAALAFAKPAEIAADGAARIVLAAGKIAGGERREVSIAITVPGEITWYPTPAEIPFPADWDRWFTWKPTMDHAAANAVGLADWATEPAGAQGRVVRQGDRLLVGGKPVKFWGLNNCYSACSPEKALADSRAALYAKMGVNAVRLHKFADGHGWAGIQSEGSFAEFDPAGLDRMDYYVAQLKAKGIYVKLSSNFGVHPGPADCDAIPWLDEVDGNGKQKGKKTAKGDRVKTGNGAIFVGSELQDLQFRQTTNLLKHKNPYTGLTYAEDPAVLVIEEFNEDSALFFGLTRFLQRSPTLTRRMAERFTDWLAKRYGDEAGLEKAWGKEWKDAMAYEGFKGESFAGRSIVPAGNPWYYDPDQLAGSQAAKKARLMDTMLFLYEMQNDFYKRYAEVIRAAGYTGEILASNWHAGRAFSHYHNLHSDYLVGLIDRHNYFGNGSMLTRAGSGMLSSGACQAADRPFMLSEWIHIFPNEWGAEGPAIIGAYGMGLQDWDVSFMFQNRDNGGFLPELGGEWEVTAPQILGLFPAVARQVRRGDVKAATVTAVRNVHMPSLAQGKLGFDDLGKASGDIKEADSATIPARSLAVARNAVAFTDTWKDTPAFDLAPYQQDGALVSSTGQLRWVEGARPHIVIDTPGTQAVVGWAESRTYRLGDIGITSRTPFAAIYVSAAGAGEDIRGAKRLIVTTLARARNTGMKYQAARLLLRGKGPIVMEPVAVELTLTRPGTPTVYACDQDGKRTATTIPVQDGTITLDGGIHKTIWYEIAYE